MAVRWLKEAKRKFIVENGTLLQYVGSDSIVRIPRTVDAIENDVFEGCKSMKQLIIPRTVTYIGSGAFSDCTGLTQVRIPNSVKEMGAGCFAGCRGLKELIIPGSVFEIGYEAFAGCPKLTVYCSEGSEAEHYCKKNNIDVKVVPYYTEW